MGLIAFLGVAVAGFVYLRRAKGPETGFSRPLAFLSSAAGTRIEFNHARTIGARSRPNKQLVGNRGWLLLYMLGLGAELAHSLGLTVGSLIIYADPSLAGLRSFIPLWALLVYVVSNLGLVAYGVVLYVLMSTKRKAAIVNNILFNLLSIAFLVVWFLLGAKSPVGTAVDCLPGLAAILYFSRSRRVRNTYIAT